jgi:DNA uptake protein ComE-like DNA-binding protein
MLEPFMNLGPSLSAALILLTASLGLLAQTKPSVKTTAPAATSQNKTEVNPFIAAQSKARSKALKAEKAKAAAKVKLVDINSASKDELKTISGITDADAARIIAGRPYKSKAHLVTHDVISAGLYDSIKKRIYAQQNLPKR